MFIILLVFLLTLLYYLINQAQRYWQKRNVVVAAPSFFVGNIGPNITGKKSLGEIFTEIYRNFEDHAFVGIYQCLTPCLLVRDLEFIKNITVRDFKHFTDNNIDLNKDANKLFARNPFVLKGEEWKLCRSRMTPCLSSGKVRAMFPILQQVAERMITFLNDGLIDSSMTTETRDVTVRYAVDNVAACVYALDGKAFEPGRSEFRQIADKLFASGNTDSIKFSISLLFPNLAKRLRIKVLSEEAENKLLVITNKALELRRKSNIVREDFLDSAIALSKNSDMTEIDVAAYCAIFFTDGYETSSRVMSFLLFELASNPDIQTKLRGEINRKLKQNGGKFTYEEINEMTYLDACYMENIRKNAIMMYLLKTCTETYTYTADESEYKDPPITVEKGTCVILPVYAIQRDKKYYDDPDKYIPDRFFDKESINKFAYITFGQGPRACFGQRFAAASIKVGVVNILKNFELSVNNKTQLPLKFDPWFLVTDPIGGLWLDFKKI